MSGGREIPTLMSTRAIAGAGTTTANAKMIVPKSNFFIFLPPSLLFRIQTKLFFCFSPKKAAGKNRLVKIAGSIEIIRLIDDIAFIIAPSMWACHRKASCCCQNNAHIGISQVVLREASSVPHSFQQICFLPPPAYAGKWIFENRAANYCSYSL
jgi:hypothetical protein